MFDVIKNYDPAALTVCTLGSHSALDICRGAKDEGLRTLVVCERGREKTYAQYFKTRGAKGVVDEVFLVDKFKDVLKPQIQEQLRQKNAVFIPHRSFQVYLDFDYDSIEKKFLVPMLGSRYLLRAEERTSPRNQYYLLEKAGVRYPKQFRSASQIDRLCLVKASEAERKFERAFFFASTPKEFKAKADELIAKKTITPAALKNAVIEEFVVGVPVNFNYFYSPLSQELELLGTDARRQTNLDGLLRLPADQQLPALQHLQPKFEEAGHFAVTILESMLDHVFDIGEKFVAATQKEYPPGMIGCFALQSSVIPGPPKKQAIVFDVSLRIPGSPGTRFTPYSGYLYGESLSAGRRTARELKKAAEQERLHEILT